MDTLSAAPSIAVPLSFTPPAPLPSPDMSAPEVNANGPMTAIRLLASLSAFVGQRLDTQA